MKIGWEVGEKHAIVKTQVNLTASGLVYYSLFLQVQIMGVAFFQFFQSRFKKKM